MQVAHRLDHRQHAPGEHPVVAPDDAVPHLDRDVPEGTKIR